MTTEAIYQKYWDALLGVEAVMVPADTAIALALRLAVQDAYAAGSALADDLAAIVASQAQPERSPADQRYTEQLQAQISRLNEWLQDHEPGLYISLGDTADAVLAAAGNRDERLATAQAEIERRRNETIALHERMIIQHSTVIAERDGLRQQLALMDVDNADLTQQVAGLAGGRAEAERLRQEIADLREQVIPDYQAEIDRLTRQNVIATDTFNSLHANGDGVDPTTPPDWGRNHPAWEALPKADLGVIDQLCNGTTTFRRLDKSLRRDLVCRAIRHLASEHDGPLPSSAWDRNRPLWLPTQGAVNMLSDGQNWSSLLAMALAPA